MNRVIQEPNIEILEPFDTDRHQFDIVIPDISSDFTSNRNLSMM